MPTPFTHPEIQGWAEDADPSVRPAVPRERLPQRLDVPWSEPEAQLVDIPVLVSSERTRVSKIFGTSAPPSGVSGLVRKLAFTYSEGDVRHWLLLLVADRINVVEGLVDDVVHLHPPNIFKEMGWKAEFKHRPLVAVAKSAGVAAAVGGALYLLFRPRRRSLFGR